MSLSTVTDTDDMDKVLTSYFDKTVNSNTIKEKPTPSSELSKVDLLKILSYLEGEVQARDVVIATLKCERVKRLLADNNYSMTSSPFAALKRDSFASYVGNNDSKEDVELVRTWENQKFSLENLVREQKQAMKHMNKILEDAEHLHKQMASELEIEKEKNQSMKDSSTMREELEVEKQLRLRLEKELNEQHRLQEEERNRHKNIVLLLLAERKWIIKQFIEERKRSADLSNVLKEEKRQACSLAEGLEEESQKALKMGAELERQTQSFKIERERLAAHLRIQEESSSDAESQLKALKVEVESLRKQLAEAHSVAMFQASIVNSPGSGNSKKSSSQSSTLVRPTATASSVAVPQPTTGVAKPISPNQISCSSASTVNSPSQSQNISSPVNSVLQTKAASPSSTTDSRSTVGTMLASKKYSLGRGVPPPVPPNKPSVPPKSGNLTAKIHAAKLEQQIS